MNVQTYFLIIKKGIQRGHPTLIKGKRQRETLLLILEILIKNNTSKQVGM